MFKSVFVTTSFVPSGEKAGPPHIPGSPTLLTTLPSRLKIVICCSCGPRGGGRTRNLSPSRLMSLKLSGTPFAGRSVTSGFSKVNEGEVFTWASITLKSWPR